MNRLQFFNKVGIYVFLPLISFLFIHSSFVFGCVLSSTHVYLQQNGKDIANSKNIIYKYENTFNFLYEYPALSPGNIYTIYALPSKPLAIDVFADNLLKKTNGCEDYKKQNEEYSSYHNKSEKSKEITIKAKASKSTAERMLLYDELLKDTHDYMHSKGYFQFENEKCKDIDNNIYKHYSDYLQGLSEKNQFVKEIEIPPLPSPKAVCGPDDRYYMDIDSGLITKENKISLFTNFIQSIMIIFNNVINNRIR